MKSLSLFALFFFLCSSSFAETKTVDSVDLKKYVGVWYEIGSIPMRFTKGCHCTRAKYSFREDGDIAVLNTCNKDSVNGKLSIATGHAKVVDPKTNAKLKVSFFWPFWGEYHIIGLDPDYRYAVVSNSKGSSLWILSRTPELEKSLLEKALDIVKANNIDLSTFKYQEQKGCTYPN